MPVFYCFDSAALMCDWRASMCRLGDGALYIAPSAVILIDNESSLFLLHLLLFWSHGCVGDHLAMVSGISHLKNFSPGCCTLVARAARCVVATVCLGHAASWRCLQNSSLRYMAWYCGCSLLTSRIYSGCSLLDLWLCRGHHVQPDSCASTSAGIFPTVAELGFQTKGCSILAARISLYD